MIWEIEVQPKAEVQQLANIRAEFELLAHGQGNFPSADRVLLGMRHGYLLEGLVDRVQVEKLVGELLVDPLVETGVVRKIDDEKTESVELESWTVLLKPGVMDPVSQSVQNAAADLDILLSSVRSFRRYLVAIGDNTELKAILQKTLANDAIEQIAEGPLSLDHLRIRQQYEFKKKLTPIRELADDYLMELSHTGQLALNLDEMRVIQRHFRELNREPTDAELETIAQTWSEHCSHKTLKGKIEMGSRRYNNLLKETIFGATQQIRERLGEDDWCVSVFEDNAGIVRFDEEFNVCFKVETHNHPSAIEPYGGANTGIGGVIRDPLGTGLGAKPICNTDVFCFAPPEPESAIPNGVLHPSKVMTGVVAGVRDYGNRMGIPTVNGAVCFDERYLGNPLVYCGTVGLIPIDRCRKQPQAGDLIVSVGGRTGRDGIHGATFSSIELSSETEEISGGAVQIGNAITEKKLVDVLIQARDLALYNAVTDCGAGGFSSAVGEMGAELGAKVQLEKAPLKYEGLSYTEIWISEAQERMVLAVPTQNWEQLKQLCDSEDVEATAIGKFEKTGRLRLFYHSEQVADLSMEFLHDGRPDVVLRAEWQSPPAARQSPPAAAVVSNTTAAGGTKTTASKSPANHTESLLKILSSLNVCSKEWIIRQYDHEVQGGTVIKPLVGKRGDGPGDAAVITPVLGSKKGLAIGCGINPHYGDLDPYRMAAAAIDEAVRNVVAVGADPSRIALLDNFCWGNTDRPEVLGSLVLAAEACRDVALAYNMPFISGKDSLKNEFRSEGSHIVIPPTLLISAMGQVPDVHRCVTMDLKEPGNLLYLVGTTKEEMGGSHLNLVNGIAGGTVPSVDLKKAPLVFSRLHQAISQGLVRSCHDLSEGGFAVALAEMAFAGGVGAEITDLHDELEEHWDAVALFSESQSRFLVEISADSVKGFEQALADVQWRRVGKTVKETNLRIKDTDGTSILETTLPVLKHAWQSPLQRFCAISG